MGVPNSKLGIKVRFAVGAVPSIGATRKVVFADRATPVVDDEDKEAAEAEEPKQQHECQPSLLAKPVMDQRAHDQPKQPDDEEGNPSHSTAMPNLPALLWCTLIHE